MLMGDMTANRTKSQQVISVNLIVEKKTCQIHTIDTLAQDLPDNIIGMRGSFQNGL